MCYTLFLIFLLQVLIVPQEIYRNEAFSVTGLSVTENGFRATALSDSSIASNYFPAFQEDLNLSFKFALNGKDNERPSGQDHKLKLRPVRSRFVSPLFVFGEDDPVGANIFQVEEDEINSINEFEVVFRLDMRNVQESFSENGYFITGTGEKILKEDFEGVYIAGGNEPLTWDFNKVKKNEKFKLKDPDQDGIYELILEFKNNYPMVTDDNFYLWELKKNIINYPSFSSEYKIINALHNLSLEESIMNIREDGAFMAGAKWDGVWTRDISYSILLSLAIINPDACKTSLLAKVKNGMIIQDTGTGGSWPVSTDRMTWALAAYEVYLTTGDSIWLQNAFNIISKSAEADLYTIFDPERGLFRGESSFLDWREQTYPLWMQPADIYDSYCLGTNVVHAATYKILADMCRMLGKDQGNYEKIFTIVQSGINKYFWIEDKGYYGQFIYGRNYLSISPKSEALGEALAVLFNIADEKGTDIIKNSPTSIYGTPVVYPQEKNIPPYHNNSVWPFVEAFRMWSAKKNNNEEAVLHSAASIMRAASFFLTNKENFVASNGSPVGTEINSDRQLWSVAGNLALVYRVLFGMSYLPGKLEFTPFIPSSIKGTYKLKNFSYGNAVYDIELSGEGNKIARFILDDVIQPDNSISIKLSGEHFIKIEMEKGETVNGINLQPEYFNLPSPEVSVSDGVLFWKKIPGAINYTVYINGKEEITSPETSYSLKAKDYFSEYQVAALDLNGISSFLSEPLRQDANVRVFNINELLNIKDQYIKLKNNSGFYKFNIDIEKPGLYSIDFDYSNGNGPVNTDNKCAIRSFKINDKMAGNIIMPQRGTDLWEEWGYSNNIKILLEKGTCNFNIYFDELNTNMNIIENNALIKSVRLTFLND